MKPVDYLLVGHVAKDLTSDGPRLGGTVAYAALTAQALGLRVGIVTSVPPEFDLLEPLEKIQQVRLAAQDPTTFENLYEPDGTRHQTLRARAAPIQASAIPDEWLHTPIVHLAPLADEVSPELAGLFPTSLVGVTPQGWMRQWDETGRVSAIPWQKPEAVLRAATAVVFSIEDVGFDENLVAKYAAKAHLLVVTRGEDGCSVHWNDSWRDFPAPRVRVVDQTGAGDIFAAAFFFRLHLARDPYEAARFATEIASASVTRPALESAPTLEDIQLAMQAAP